MRKSIILTAALLSACSQPVPHRESSPNARFETDSEESAAAPGVNVTAAPGVAFNYRYAFRLPGSRIAQIQDAHAQACEKLGIAKCRITGMRYRLVNQKDIEAMLALRLDPALARSFGKDATELVRKSDGMLVDQEITGEDVGTKIAGANRSEAELRAELARVEAELARPVPMIRGSVAPQAAADRQSLLNRASELRLQLAAVGKDRSTNEEALSGTPMVFNYGSGSVVPGFDVRSPLRDALQQSWDNLVGGFAAILVIVITLIPWALVAAFLVLAYRLFRRRWEQSNLGYRKGETDTAEGAPSRPRRRKSSDS